MKLHGHTTIELTDVNTGKKKKYEDDNIVTNALQHLLMGGGVFQWNPLRNLFTSNENGTYTKEMLVNTLTRGLMLFDGTIEENVENVKPPCGVSVVGCGSGITYTGDNTMAGSYNNQESGETGNGWKHVWDFSTNQANGSIACACLTTQGGGKVTEGTFPFADDYMIGSTDATMNKEDYAFKIPSVGYQLKQLSGGQWDNDTCRFSVLHLDGKKNRMLRLADYDEMKYYYFNSTSGTDYTNFQKSLFYKKSVDIDIYRMPVTNMSIFDFNTFNKEHSDMLEDTVTVEMPQGLKELITQELLDTPKRYWAAFHNNDENYIYITLNIPSVDGSYSYIEKEGKLYVWKISVEDFSSTYFEIINTTGERVLCNPGYLVNYRKMILAYEDYTFMIGESKKLYIINSQDSTDVAVASFPDGTTFEIEYIFPIYFEKGKLIFAKGAGGSEQIFACDALLHEVRYKNAYLSNLYNGSSDGSVVVSGKVYGTNFIGTNNWDRVGNWYLLLGNDPELLVTINNLSTPVVKTASETMKVTYTITKTEE